MATIRSQMVLNDGMSAVLKRITLHGLENVNAMYKEYHALGGNGTVTALVNTIHELEVRDDKRPASQA